MPPNLLSTAIAQHQAGRLEVAEAIYRQILAGEPQQADALHLLGVLHHQRGQHEQAVALLERAIRLRADRPFYHSNLGEAYRALGRQDEAIGCYRRALDLDPALAGVHFNLGNALKEDGQLAAAIVAYERALQLDPREAKVHNNLGNTRRAAGELPAAVTSLRTAVELSPDYAEAWNNLGLALSELKQHAEAVACFQRVLQLRPEMAAGYSNLGNVFKDRMQLDEAAACYRRAIQLAPEMAEAHTNLGMVLLDQGEADEALAAFRRGAELQPDDYVKQSNLLYMLLYTGNGAATSRVAHERWYRRWAEPLMRESGPHANDRSTERRLRIGYVSPDFREHPVGRMLLPLLESHDHERFEICCYASQTIDDRFTARFRPLADEWRNVASLTDQQLAETIRRDRIDILVDLTMHTAGNRLLTFARKPAPVQATYLAYCGTTGLPAIDYRLTDARLDPPDAVNPFVEEPFRLPDTFWCYRAPLEAPEVAPLPALAAGYVTFGCQNNFCKGTVAAREAWSRLLGKVPNSRLVLFVNGGSQRERAREFFAQRDVAPERLSFVGAGPLAEYLGRYAQIDIALDPFPYNGATTTCDALWMGAPVVSLAGAWGQRRSGLSILSTVELADLVAADEEQYVDIAAVLASDVGRLAELRAGLRARMQASPLTDSVRFARSIEAAYRAMWRRWCAS
jgi:predicted O-linked N-acetylglucosamine transferase (SPINDLY family)